MFLSDLKIKNFRNLPDLSFHFNDFINYIHSPNGTGKTNLLEAIQCLTVGKTLRSTTESDIVNINSKDLEANKTTVYLFGEFTDSEDIKFSQTFLLEITPKKRKQLLINKNKVSFNEFLGRVPSIWFSPESIRIINSSPLNKRKYFDDILIQLYPEYNFDLKNYNKALRQRNRLLQEPETLKAASIRIWTEGLIKYGCKVINARKKFFHTLNEEFAQLKDIHRYKFKIEFHPDIKLNDFFEEDTEYKFREELRNSYQKDLRIQSTSVGPHRDDWHMLISMTSEEIDAEFIRADKFASRGQQRMALIMLQMILVRIFEKHIGKKPILLLDDIFSELDEENEKILIDFIQENKLQSFITGVEKKKFKNIKEYNLTKYTASRNADSSHLSAK